MHSEQRLTLGVRRAWKPERRRSRSWKASIAWNCGDVILISGFAFNRARCYFHAKIPPHSAETSNAVEFSLERFERFELSEVIALPVHPAVDVDLVAFVLRDVEGVSVGIEAAVLGHGPAAWPLADAAFGQ